MPTSPVRKPTTFRDMLKTVKEGIREVSADDVAALGESVMTLDVRELDEYDQGCLPGALHIARGQLESQIESRIPDRGRPIVIYCASGVRSAFAAKTLGELGYENVSSMAGGFNRWKDDGRAYITPVRLSSQQRNRYQRHILLPEIGEEGQKKLLDARVLLIGAGGLGSPAAMYLAAAGVGRLGILDMDVVDASNLQRQLLHTTERIGWRKVDSAKAALEALNEDVDIVGYDERLDASSVERILAGPDGRGWDVIVDGTDNFPTRYLLNDATVNLAKAGSPVAVVHGSIFRFEGQVTVFAPLEGPCYRCMIPNPPPAELAPSCAEAGVLGVLPGIIGSIQALEAVKLIVGIGNPLIGRLLSYDALDESFRTFNVRRDPLCLACGPGVGNLELVDYDEFCLPGHVRSGG